MRVWAEMPLTNLPCRFGRPIVTMTVMTIRRALSALACAASLATTSACGQPSLPSVHSRFVGTRCADVIVLGLRGSGQSLDLNEAVGQEVLRTVEAMTDRLHKTSDRTVRLEAVPYDATISTTYAHYEYGVRDGQRLLGKLYEKALTECPKSRFAFVGFSQGAQAVHEYSYDLTGAKARRLVLIGMVADPRKNPDDTISTWSYASKPTTGHGELGAGPLFGPGVRQAAIALCVGADEVCNAPIGGSSGAPSQTHRHFYESDTTAGKTGKQLAGVLKRHGFG